MLNLETHQALANPHDKKVFKLHGHFSNYVGKRFLTCRTNYRVHEHHPGDRAIASA